MAHAAAARRSSPRRRGTIRWDRVGRLALVSTLVVILGLYISPALHWLRQSHTAGEQRQELRDMTREHRALARRARALRDPGAIEREARRLGMVRQGERSYVIENLPDR
ncbi:MAG: septum formation initiator family protein [Thermoleophilaceae bacterium]